MESKQGLTCIAGSNRSFTAYVFKRTSTPGRPYRGPADLLLDAQLNSPRLLQASLPRILRPRRGHPATHSAADPLTHKAGKDSAGRHVRVTLQDNLERPAPASGDGASKRAQNCSQAKEGTGATGKMKGKVLAQKEAAAVSAAETALVGQTLKPADLHAAIGSTSLGLGAAVVLPKDVNARGSRRQRRAEAAQQETNAQLQQCKGATCSGVLKAVDASTTGASSVYWVRTCCAAVAGCSRFCWMLSHACLL